MCGGEVVPCNEATQQAVGYVFLSSVMIRVASLICQEPMSVVLSFVATLSVVFRCMVNGPLCWALSRILVRDLESTIFCALPCVHGDDTP